MIELDRARVVRDGRTTLHDLTLSIAERCVGIVGANGSGKSTFLRLLNGLLLPQAGSVRVFGLDTRAETTAVRRRVGFLFQNPDNQLVMPSVGEDVAFGLRKAKLSGKEMRARVAACLTPYDLAGFEDRLVHELSGGERQLVALAGVMVMEPDLLVLDEPTTLLDRRNRRRFMAAVEAAKRPVVLATHDLALLEGFDRVLVFDAGRLVADAEPDRAIRAYEALHP